MTYPRSAIITGGGSGIGAAVARRLAASGTSIALLGRTPEKLEAVRAEIAPGASRPPLALAMHQEDAASVRDAVEAVTRHFGGIDLLFNNAGIYEPGPACESPLERWDRTMAVNFRGPLLLSRAVVPHMRAAGGGVIINNASTLGFRPVPGVAPYACSKAALLMLTQCLALEEAEHGIRVVAICPGVVDTPIHGTGQGHQAGRRDGSDPASGRHAEFLAEMARLHPLGRVGTTGDIAALVEYLAGPEAGWVTGSSFTIDGGISLR